MEGHTKKIDGNALPIHISKIIPDVFKTIIRAYEGNDDRAARVRMINAAEKPKALKK